MINKLTKQQEARFPEFVDKWVKIGLETTPANRKAAEESAIQAYKIAGLPPPKYFHWVPGPLEGARLAGVALKSKNYKEFMSGKVQGSSSEGLSIRGLGQFSASWAAFYDYFGEACNLECVKQLDGLIGLIKNCSMWWAFEELVILCERPAIIARDDQGRLHSQTGPCLEYTGDLKFYAWHGTVVPEAWIMKKPTPAEVLSCTNVEQRRAGAEIVGWVNILKGLKAKSLDVDADPMIGELLEVDLPDAPKSKFLKVRCGTGRDFCMPVPPDMKTALEANSWTFDLGIDLDQFRNYKVRT